MNLISLKRASYYDVQKWLIRTIPELSAYQKEKIDEDMIRRAPFYFYEDTKKVNNVLLRFSIIFYPIVLFFLLISLLFNFFITGKWGYNKLKWFSKWVGSLGL